MKLPYYPGCTLYTKAKSFDESARNSLKVLGIELVELPTWTCCGASFPLVSDNLMVLLAPIRNLALASKEGETLVTACAFCHNVLKRANRVVKDNPEKRDKINDFIEEKYEGHVKVQHLLEVLRDEIGFKNIGKEVKRGLEGLRVAPYYGCYLLRPFEEMGMDDPENPRILEDFLRSLGCEVINFPYKTECCGSYLSVSSSDVATDCSYPILNSASMNGAEVLALSCPLCHYNLDERQREIKAKHQGFGGIPVLYFTQLLGVALEIDIDHCGLDRHYVDPRPLLEAKNLISQGR
ncbi:MAG: CoB--CoM heterodisulfide reductase iron-sulfur subunit B family protein [Candidatus Geothermarchaeales archaeon]